MSYTLPRIVDGFLSDRRRMPVQVAGLRALRTLPLLTVPEYARALRHNPAAQRHIEAIDPEDRHFYVSHRHYLARGLTRSQRAAAALLHYEHELTTFDARFFEAVHEGDGIVLWRLRRAGVELELRLISGCDVLYEGGLTVVLFVDGNVVSVQSFAFVDRDMIFDIMRPPGSPRSPTQSKTLFLCRKQLGSDHRYQNAVNLVLDRCSVPHVCHAAMSGIAMLHGWPSIAAVRAQAQCSYRPERERFFQVSYEEYWQALGGRVRGRFAYEIAVPPALKPLDQLSSKARQRARRRRAHLAKIRESVRDVLAGYRR